MSSESPYDQYCDAWPVFDTRPEDEFEPCTMFSINFNVAFMFPSLDPTVDDDLFHDDLSMITTYKSFLVQHDQLIINDDTSRFAIHEKLCDMHVPVMPFMIDRILNCALSMSKDNRDMRLKVLRMEVSIQVVVDESPVAVLEDLEESSMDVDEQVLRMVPATKSSIEELEKVKVECSTKECAICFEELLIGMEATRMPCAHLFHGGCIGDWLEKSHLCPLCRFEMPS